MKTIREQRKSAITIVLLICRRLSASAVGIGLFCTLKRNKGYASLQLSRWEYTFLCFGADISDKTICVSKVERFFHRARDWSSLGAYWWRLLICAVVKTT